MISRREVVFLSRFHFGFVGNYGSIGFYGGSRKFFYRFAFFVNLNIRNLEVRAFVAVHNELHSNPCAIFRHFYNNPYLGAIPRAVPLRVADYRRSLAVRIACNVCRICQEGDLVTACIRYVRCYVFYVNRYLLTCRQIFAKHKDVRTACRTYHLQVAVYNRVGYVLFFAEIIDLIFRREIIFRSRFRNRGDRRRVACVLNSNTRNLPIRIRVTNVTELNSQPGTIFRDFRGGSEFTAIPKRGRFPLGYLLTVELCVARGHCAPGPKPPSVYDIPHYFTVDFYKLTCLQRSLQHEDGIKVRRRRIRFKVDRGKL